MPMPEYSEQHVWVGAATIPLDDKQARRAVLRHSVRIPANLKIPILETYCDQCRRPWDDVCDEPCEAYASNEHLRGGPIKERRKRKHGHDCQAVGCPGPRGEYASSDDDDEGMAMSATG